jgi:predicted DNA-binding transcriptional regulator AlpA
MKISDITKNDKNVSKLAKEINMPSLLSVSELASYLHKSVRWIHMEHSAGRLPQSLKIGRSRYWFRHLLP